MTSLLTLIENVPADPCDMFRSILARVDEDFIVMNLATMDSKLGPLNRTVVYRGLMDGGIVFVTERLSRKYENLKQDARVGLTLYLPKVKSENNGNDSQLWQVRLIGAEAIELTEQQISELWSEEPFYARMRSHITECGKQVDDPLQMQKKCDHLLQQCNTDKNKLKQTESYTAFKVLPEIWDFFKNEPGKIADRVQYRRENDQTTSHWRIMHVEP